VEEEVTQILKNEKRDVVQYYNQVIALQMQAFRQISESFTELTAPAEVDIPTISSPTVSRVPRYDTQAQIDVPVSRPPRLYDNQPQVDSPSLVTRPPRYDLTPNYESPPAAGSTNGETDWQEYQDDEGNTYYYNTITGESSWEKPI